MKARAVKQCVMFRRSEPRSRDVASPAAVMECNDNSEPGGNGRDGWETWAPGFRVWEGSGNRGILAFER
jgi:hypothetical protein